MKVEIAPVGGSYTDITSLIKLGGVSWSLNSVDADGAGRTLDGTMQRKLIGVKSKLEISCVPLTTTQKDTLTTLLSPEWLSVKVTTTSGTSTYTMYPGSTLQSAYLMRRSNGDELWEEFSFSLIER